MWPEVERETQGCSLSCMAENQMVAAEAAPAGRTALGLVPADKGRRKPPVPLP